MSGNTYAKGGRHKVAYCPLSVVRCPLSVVKDDHLPIYHKPLTNKPQITIFHTDSTPAWHISPNHADESYQYVVGHISPERADEGKRPLQCFVPIFI